jgi:hypothetical protein
MFKILTFGLETGFALLFRVTGFEPETIKP